MIEKIVLDYLMGKLGDIVFLETPKNKTSFILIEKIGSSHKEHIKTSTIAIQSFDKSLYKTALLNEKVKDVMNNIIELDNIVKIELNSDYNYTDTAVKRYRYQALFHIVHY